MPAPGSPTDALPARHAAALGAVHGLAELLPVSSSGHLTLVPWLLGWPAADLDPELRKAFEVALHAGSGAALLLARRREAIALLRGLDRRRASVLAASLAPAAAAGLLLERPIERHLGRPGPVAVGMLLGAAGLAAADRASGTRPADDAGARDGLALGLAQVAALVPGVSRAGATLTAARLRGFAPVAASELSHATALPVITAATALMGLRLARRPVRGGVERALLAGGVAALGATTAGAAAGGLRADDGSLRPWAAYRAALAAAVLVRTRVRV